MIFHLAYCSSVLYHPSKETFFTPEKLGYTKRDVFLKVDQDIQLHIWHIQPKSEKSRNAVILQFHGNGQNMTSHFLSLVWLVDHGYDLFTYDYRGYGQTKGDPNPEVVNQDSVKVIRYVSEYCQKKGKKLIIYGQSLGGAVAMRALHDVPDKSDIILVMIDGSFASYKQVSRSILSKQLIVPLPFILSFFVSNSYSPADFISKISPIPMIIVHGTNDNIVPFENGKEVFRLAEQPKQFWEIRGAGHVDWMNFGRGNNAKKFVSLLNDMVDQYKNE
ncbi:MAG: alpha/beta hydrolase [Leptospiraceae bacterium]|nr:alpha/beta hydrolase [Leptospiraceae bacterium]MCP5495139.1 alpha/beta hydrolase [Leptospiraceae bacterium]